MRHQHRSDLKTENIQLVGSSLLNIPECVSRREMSSQTVECDVWPIRKLGDQNTERNPKYRRWNCHGVPDSLLDTSGIFLTGNPPPTPPKEISDDHNCFFWTHVWSQGYEIWTLVSEICCLVCCILLCCCTPHPVGPNLFISKMFYHLWSLPVIENQTISKSCHHNNLQLFIGDPKGFPGKREFIISPHSFRSLLASPF